MPDELAKEIEEAARARSFPDGDAFLVAALREFMAKQRSQSSVNDVQTEAFHRRTVLLESAWEDSAGKALTLSALVAAMRQSSQTAHPSTSIYFAGADVDHPYFLQSDSLGIGIAVLPEDAAKALTRKRHPHQVEVMFILDGALRLHVEANPPIVLQKGDYYVIGKNVCHWVTPIENQPGVFAFVKTNPAQEPRGVSC